MIESLVAVVLFCAAPQDTDKETAVKEAIKLSRELRAKAKTEDDVSKSIQVLSSAERHPLIRQELIDQLAHIPPLVARLHAAEGLRPYRFDESATAALIRCAREKPAVKAAVPLRLKCLDVFAEVAPSRRAGDLKPLFSDPDLEVAGATVVAARTMGSLRLLLPLITSLGELETLPAGNPRRGKLLTPTREAIGELWKKVDGRKPPQSYPEANRAYQSRRHDIQKLIEEEDRQDDTGR